MSIDFTNYTKLPFDQEYPGPIPYDHGGITNTFFPAGAPISGRELNEVQERLQSQFYNLAQSIALLISRHYIADNVLLNGFIICSGIKKAYDDNNYCYGMGYKTPYLCYQGKIYPIPENTIGTEQVPIVDGPIYLELSREIDVGINGNTQLYKEGLHSIVIENKIVYSGELISCDEYFNENFVNSDGDTESIISARKVRNMIIRNGGGSTGDSYMSIPLGSVSHDENGDLKYSPSFEVIDLNDVKNQIDNHIHKDIELTVVASDFALAKDGSYQYSKDLRELGITISVANPIVSINNKQLDINNYQSMQESFSCIDKAIVQDNVLTLTCFSQKPDTGIPIIIKVV